MIDTRTGGTTAYKKGSLKRRLDSVTLALLSSDGGGSTSATLSRKLVLKNLPGSVKVQLGIGISPTQGGIIYRASQYPTVPGTIQLHPVTNYPDANKVAYRPVFQDPTSTDNTNDELPQNIPFGWEFDTEADEIYIDVEVTSAEYLGTDLDGRLVVQATVEYNGDWWDPKAIEFAMGQIQLTGASAAPFTIGTGGE